FDGLDEVHAGGRLELVRAVKSFLQTYPECRFVVTCRPVLYRDELAGVVDGTLEIQEFTAQQVRRFLSLWKQTLPAEHPFSVEPFLRGLRDREGLSSLAHQPL